MILRGGPRILAAALALSGAPLGVAWAGPAALPRQSVAIDSVEPGFSGWSQVKTDHFVFVYEQRDSEAVAELLSFAEEVYGQVTTFLESAPRQVTVVVRGRVDSANGYTAASPPHIVLYVAPPSEPLIGLDAASYLRLLFVHELTHFVNFQFDRGVLSIGENLFGPSVKEAEAILYGYAMMEGIATVTETEFTDGGRGRNPFFELEPRGLARERSFFTLRRVSYGSDFPPLDRVWLGGYLFVHHLLDRYGPDIMKKVHAAYAAAPLLGPWAAVRTATGSDAGELFQDMVGSLQARYGEEKPVEAGRRLSPERIGDWFLPLATEAGWFLYRRTQGDAGAVVRWDPRTGKEEVLLATSMSDASSLTASMDGKRIVFATTEQTVGRSGPLVLSDLYALDPSTRAVRRLTKGARLWQPRLSPDGSTLIAVQAVGAHTRLVKVDPDSGNVAVLYARAGATLCTPAFSPDGSHVAFGVQEDGRNDILLVSLPLPAEPPDERLVDVNADAAAPLLSQGAGKEYYPSFIDNDTVAFSSDRGSALALYAAPLAGDPPTMICQDPVGAWSGVIVKGKVVYATWRPTGFTLMEKEAVQGPVETRQEKQRAPRAAVPPIPSSRGYIDWPRFIYWAPLPVYDSTIASGELLFAPGILLGLLSNLETTSLSAAISFRTDWLQPAVELDFETVAGTTYLSYLVSEGFTTAPGRSVEALQQQLAFSFPLVSSAALRTKTSLVAGAGLVDSVILDSVTPFSFADGFRAGQGGTAPSLEHDFGVTAGLVFSRVTSGSSLDLFAPHALRASATGVIYPPTLSDSGAGAFVQGLFSLAFPSLFPHQVIKLGLKTSYTTFGQRFIQVTNPRGDFDSVVQLLPGRTLLSLDYQFPIALLDAPLFYAFGLVALGGGAHVEAAADWSPASAVLVPDNYLYAGLEILFVFSVGESDLPVILGTSVRFDPRFATPFDWSTDIRPYIVISTDSFSGSARANRIGAAPVLVRAR